MNRLLLSLVLLAGSALAAEPTNTRNPPAATTPTNSVLCTNENLTNATISGIDVKARTVTVKGADLKTYTLSISKLTLGAEYAPGVKVDMGYCGADALTVALHK